MHIMHTRKDKDYHTTSLQPVQIVLIVSYVTTHQQLHINTWEMARVVAQLGCDRGLHQHVPLKAIGHWQI